MTYLEMLVSISSEVKEDVKQRAKKVLKDYLLPKEITGELIERYMRRARRNGAWRSLSPQAKALLLIARRWERFFSPFMNEVIGMILMDIYMFTFKGKALFYGILISISRGVGKIKMSLDRIFYMGCSYLNSPIWMRIFD